MSAPIEKATNAANAGGLGSNLHAHAQSIADIAKLQSIGETMTQFQRLEKGFMAQGWRLYPLSGDTLLATMPRLSVQRVLPDLRAAQILLRQIGGAA